MKHSFLFSMIMLGVCNTPLHTQSPTTFHRVGSQDEKVQDLFPGSHRARPVLADYTNNNRLDLFYGGQDLGGSTNWYLQETNPDTRWGDQGNGKYVNPLLNADYSDPDVIRVGEKYYMICSDFHFIGLPVLESDDMINWRIISQVYDKFNFPEYNTNERYGGGSWAPAIRYHDNKYWVYFCTPNEGLFMSNAANPAGPWLPLLNVKNISGWEDPCPLWDDDGQTYLGRSQLGGGPIIIHKMSADGTTLLDNGTMVYSGSVSEGTKLFKKDGYYYISIPEGGVGTGWQTVLRAANIYGPYEKKVVLEQGTTNVNGPHQGALVDTPDGEWWFYHFQSKDPLGRIVHLQPVIWKDGFPQIGADIDGNGIGEPVKEWTKPNTGAASAVFAPQTSDDFASSTLGLQWQFNHNPVNTHWSLTERPGYFRVKAQKANKLRDSKNMLTQKNMGYYSEATTALDCCNLANGQRAGLFCVGNKYNAVGVERKNGSNSIYFETDGMVETIVPITASTVYFKTFVNANNNHHQLYYSADNLTFIPVKEAYSLGSGDWKGSRVGIFSYNTQAEAGEADFDYFTYQVDGPGGFVYENTDIASYVDWHVWNELAALVENNGNGSFNLVQEYEANIQQTIWTNAVFFDYDNDGNLDLLVVGKGGDWRFPMSKKYALLYRNLGATGNYRFEQVYNTGFRQECDEMYFNALSVGDYDHDGYNDVVIMSNDGSSRSVDVYKNNQGNGSFTRFALPNPASNGSVMFGDIDNDGWLDVFYTGYSTKARGIGLYRNQQDGTFQDITPSNIEGSFESQSVLSDVNGDGALDIVVTGHGDNWARYTSIYYNTINPTTKLPEFTLKTSDQTGIVPVNKANLLFADYNNDGLQDLVVNGYDGSKDLMRVYYQNAQQKFILDNNRPLFSIKDGGINMGDVNGDGNMDVVIAGYKGSDTGDAYGSPVRIYENQPATTNLPPSAPASVQANYENGQLIISWQAATDDISAQSALRYNLYVKSNTTGKIWMLIPADITTGRIKTGTDLQTSLSSQVNSYAITLPQDDYTVGVQALDQAYAGGLFITVSGFFETGLSKITNNSATTAYVDKAEVLNIKSESHIQMIRIYNLSGQILLNKEFSDNKQLQQISLASFSKGSYIVQIQTEQSLAVAKFTF